MLKPYVTTDFCNGCKKLVDSNKIDVVNSLRTAIILLINERTIPKRYHDHELHNSPYREMHISGDVLLLYKRELDDSLILSLKFSELTDHKGLRTKSSKDDHQYFEVSNEDLHDITSSTNVDDIFLNDFLESISDYASMDLTDGYVVLSDYFLRDNKLHCEYDYCPLDDCSTADSIDYVIDLDNYAPRNIYDLKNNLYSFASEVANAFK